MPDLSAQACLSGAALPAPCSICIVALVVLRIAIIQRFLPSRSRGGVGHFAHGLAQALVANGHQVTVFSEDPAPEGATYQVRVVPAIGGRLSPLGFPFALRRCDFRNFDVVHAQGDEQWLRRRGRAPVVRTMHGTSLAEAWFNGVRAGSVKRFVLHLYFYAMELIADLRATRVVGISSGTARYYPRMHAIVPNGIDLSRFAEAAARNAKSARPSIVFVGELNSRKRGLWLVDVFSREVRSQVPDAELWVVSPDRLKHVPDGVVLLGTLTDTDLAARIAQAWVLCLPSAYEGFGRPYAEAMAARTVAASTRNPGADDVLDGGRAGVLTNDRLLGAALVGLLNNSAERERLIEIGAVRVAQYSWPRVAASYEAVYAAAMSA